MDVCTQFHNKLQTIFARLSFVIFYFCLVQILFSVLSSEVFCDFRLRYFSHCCLAFVFSNASISWSSVSSKRLYVPHSYEMLYIPISVFRACCFS